MSRRYLVGDDLSRTLRDLEDRLARIETSKTVVLGGWRIEVDAATNDLIATYIPTGTVTVIAVP